MTKRRRRICFAIMAILFVLCAGSTWLWFAGDGLHVSDIERIHNGMSLQEVCDILASQPHIQGAFALTRPKAEDLYTTCWKAIDGEFIIVFSRDNQVIDRVVMKTAGLFAEFRLRVRAGMRKTFGW